MMKREICFLGLVLPCLLVAVVSCGFVGPSVWVERTTKVEIDSTGVETLEVFTNNGKVVAQGKSAEAETKILVTAKIRAGGSDDQDAQDCLKAIGIRVAESGGKRVVRAHWKDEKKSTWGKSVSYDIALPSRLSLDVETDNGRIEVSGVRGPCTLKSDNGRILVSDDAGDLRVITDNGRVEVDTEASNVDLNSDNGSIKLELRTAGKTRGEIVTDNGNVSVRFPEGASTEIDAATDNGRISTDLNLQNAAQKKKSLKGTLGAGGERLKIRTDNGNIELK